MSWASEELKHADLGDARRNRRLIKIVEDLSSQPNESVPQASRDKAALSGTYDFWGNRRISASGILEAHTLSTIERVKGHSMVLAIQDTTELDFSAHRGKRGMGPLHNRGTKGIFVHSVLCASCSGVPLGLLHQLSWSRKPNKGGRGSKERKRLIAEKESYRWLEGLSVSQSLIPAEIGVVMMSDRECDIYEFLSSPRREGSEYLIRASHNRKVTSSPVPSEVLPLWDSLRSGPIEGEHTIELQRTPRRRARSATLSIRYARVELQPPERHPQRDQLPPLSVNVVLAEELNPPCGEKAISWMLLTTLPVSSLSEAVEILTMYTVRWLVERYFYSLKVGCRLEELQLESADRIERALSTYSIVAWRLLWLTYAARVEPTSSVDGILERSEWQALYCFTHKGSDPPNESPSIGDCVLWIAKLGGFLGRKSDGSPGVKTLWRGFDRLSGIVVAWELFRGQLS